MNHALDDKILVNLIIQVASAVPEKGTELDVTTIITRPMWRAWCRAIRVPEDSEPTDWIGQNTIRVYGSKTIVVESDIMAAVSFAS